MIVLRRHPDTKQWHWFCATCTAWSQWPNWENSFWHADLHARRYCRGTTT